MSNLRELIVELCPNGVEYKSLGDIVSIERGKRLVREQLSEEGKYPVYQNSMTPLGYHTEYNYDADTTFIIGAGAAGEIGYSKVKFWAADDCYPLVCSENISSRYIYHALLREQPRIKSRVRKASIPRLSRNSIEQLKIPVPPIEVQREIVQILDNFTELTEEITERLTAELTARKKQYEYYRDTLLTFGVHREGTFETKWRTLGEVCDLSAGGDVPKDKFSKEKTEEFTVPIFSNGVGNNALYGYTDKAKIKAPCVTIAARGTIGYCALHNEDFYPIIRLICAKPKDCVLAGYLKYYVDTLHFQVPTSGIPQLTVPMVAKYKIPVPEIEIQKKIVDVLDNFDAICSDLNIGLPAEIEARKKQYEYYRDMLLTFAAADDIILTDRQTDRQTKPN